MRVKAFEDKGSWLNLELLDAEARQSHLSRLFHLLRSRGLGLLIADSTIFVQFDMFSVDAKIISCIIFCVEMEFAGIHNAWCSPTGSVPKRVSLMRCLLGLVMPCVALLMCVWMIIIIVVRVTCYSIGGLSHPSWQSKGCGTISPVSAIHVTFKYPSPANPHRVHGTTLSCLATVTKSSDHFPMR